MRRRLRTLGSALMIYVAVGLAGHQPGTGAALLARTAGIAATAISAVSGLLLVPDEMSFGLR